MPGCWLLLSCPPYDPAKAQILAEGTGLSLYDAKMKINLPLTDVWKVFADASAGAAVQKQLADRGLRTVLADAALLQSPPAAKPVSAFELKPDALVAEGKGEVYPAVPWGQIGLLVCVQTESHGSHQEGMSESEARMKNMNRMMTGFAVGVLTGGMIGPGGKKAKAGPVVKRTELDRYFDLYAPGAGGLQRLRFRQSTLDYAGLGAQRQPVGVQNWPLLVEVIRRRAPGAEICEAALKATPKLPAADGLFWPKILEMGGIPVTDMLRSPVEVHSLLQLLRVLNAA